MEEDLRNLLGAWLHGRAAAAAAAVPALSGAAREKVGGSQTRIFTFEHSAIDLEIAGGKAAKNNLIKAGGVCIDKIVDRSDGDYRCVFKRISVNAGADRGERDALQALLMSDFERTSIA